MSVNKVFIIIILFACLFSTLPLFAGGTAEKAVVLNIAAAGNLSEVIPELNSLYLKTHPEVELNVSLASTGKLTTQILSGAPFDILLGANTAYPEKIAAEGLAAAPIEVYACGEIILFSRYGQGFDEGIGDLCDIEVYRHVVIANPDLAPYGAAAISALGCCGIDMPPGRIITAETIKQAATMAVTAADAGILAKSTIIRNPDYNPEGAYWVSIPAESYEPIEQAMVMIKNAAWKESRNELKSYHDFILSDEAGEIFKLFGYAVPAEGCTGN